MPRGSARSSWALHCVRPQDEGIDPGSAKKRPKSSPARVRQQESPPSPQSNDRDQRRHLAAREERRNSATASEIDMTGTDDESESGSQPVGLSSVQNGVPPLFVGGDLSAAGADSFDDNSSCTGSVAASVAGSVAATVVDEGSGALGHDYDDYSPAPDDEGVVVVPLEEPKARFTLMPKMLKAFSSSSKMWKAILVFLFLANAAAVAVLINPELKGAVVQKVSATVSTAAFAATAVAQKVSDTAGQMKETTFNYYEYMSKDPDDFGEQLKHAQAELNEERAKREKYEALAMKNQALAIRSTKKPKVPRENGSSHLRVGVISTIVIGLLTVVLGIGATRVDRGRREAALHHVGILSNRFLETSLKFASMFTSYVSTAMTEAINIMTPVFEYIIPILKRIATNFALNTAVAYVANTFYPLPEADLNEADGWENVDGMSTGSDATTVGFGIPVADVD